MKKYLWIGISLWVLQGCAGIQKTGFIENYDELKRLDMYSQAHLNSDYKYDATQTIDVKEAKIANDLKIKEEYEKKLYADHLKNSFEEQLTKKELFKVNPEVASDLELESFIGKLNPGSGFMRWFFGLGLGASDIQVEARIVETATRRTLASFAYRRKDAGNAAFGLNMSELDNEKQVQNSLGEASKIFVKHLEKEWKKK